MGINTFIIVTWNNENEIDLLFESLKKYAPDSKAIVVDNASKDNTIHKLKEIDYAIEIIDSKENLGFSLANNLAVKNVTTEYVTLLNPDAILTENTNLDLAFEELKNPQVGLVGGKLLNLDNSLQPSIFAFQKPLTILIEQFGIGKFLPSFLKANLSPERSNHDVKREVDWLVGAFLVMKTSDYRKIKGFSDDYFLYAEDMDIAYKLKLIGLKRIFDPKIEVCHIGGTSEKQDILQSKREKLLLAFSIFAKKFGLKNNVQTLYISYFIKAGIVLPFSIFSSKFSKKFTEYKQSVEYLKELKN